MEPMEIIAPRAEKVGPIDSLEVCSPTSTVTGQEVMVDSVEAVVAVGPLGLAEVTTVVKVRILVETPLQGALEVDL